MPVGITMSAMWTSSRKIDSQLHLSPLGVYGKEGRLSVKFLSHRDCGQPGAFLQICSVGSKSIQFASSISPIRAMCPNSKRRCHLIVEESGGFWQNLASEHWRSAVGTGHTGQCINPVHISFAPLMLSHLLVHLPPRPLRSHIALFSMPPLISVINFHFHFVNQFHLFMLTSIHPSVLHSPHPSPLYSFTLNSKLTFLVNLFPHRSPTIEPRTDFLG